MTYIEYQNLIRKYCHTVIFNFMPTFNEIGKVALELFMKEWDIQNEKGILGVDEQRILKETRSQMETYSATGKWDFSVKQEEL